MLVMFRKIHNIPFKTFKKLLCLRNYINFLLDEVINHLAISFNNMFILNRHIHKKDFLIHFRLNSILKLRGT